MEIGAKIEEYRKIVKDNITPDSKVQKRIEFLEALCRNVIRATLDNEARKKVK